MGEYIRGMVVKLHVTPEQEVLFKKNYGCTRKTYNELLNKYKDKYGGSNKIPSKNELNQFLNESKKEIKSILKRIQKRVTILDGNRVHQSSTGT